MLSGRELLTVGLTDLSDALCFMRFSERMRAIVCLLISGMALSIFLAFQRVYDLNYNFQNPSPNYRWPAGVLGFWGFGACF